MNEKNLEITLKITSENTFDVEIFEPGSGDFTRIKCHDNGDSVLVENGKLADEIRSWAMVLREELEKAE